MFLYLKLLFQLVLSPAQGWDDIAATKPDPHKMLLHGLLPLVGLTALSVGFAALWLSHPVVSNIIISAVITFAVYMLSYFCCIWVVSALLPHISSDGLISRRRIQLYAAFLVGQMALIGFIENVVPAKLVLLQFLPLLLMVEMAKARDFLGAATERTGMVTTIGVLGVIVPVYLFFFIFS